MINYSQSEIEKIIQTGESEFIEFKSVLRDPVILARQISAFANKQGGLVLVGIREPIEIVGCKINQLEKVLERAKSIVKPLPKIEFASYTIDNKEIGLIKIEKSDEIVFASGGIFERIGDATIAMNSQSIKNKLIQLKSPVTNESIATALEQQTKIIEELREEIKSSNSLKNKIKDYLIGGIIGAIIGLLLTLIFL